MMKINWAKRVDKSYRISPLQNKDGVFAALRSFKKNSLNCFGFGNFECYRVNLRCLSRYFIVLYVPIGNIGNLPIGELQFSYKLRLFQISKETSEVWGKFDVSGPVVIGMKKSKLVEPKMAYIGERGDYYLFAFDFGVCGEYIESVRCHNGGLFHISFDFNVSSETDFFDLVPLARNIGFCFKKVGNKVHGSTIFKDDFRAITFPQNYCGRFPNFGFNLSQFLNQFKFAFDVRGNNYLLDENKLRRSKKCSGKKKNLRKEVVLYDFEEDEDDEIMIDDYDNSVDNRKEEEDGIDNEMKDEEEEREMETEEFGNENVDDGDNYIFVEEDYSRMMEDEEDLEYNEDNEDNNRNVVHYTELEDYTANAEFYENFDL